MGASIRVIKLVRDIHGNEAFTLEFECEVEEAKDLLTELTSTAYGRCLINLLNTSKFLPEIPTKSKDELKAEAKEEEERIEKNEERLKRIGRREGRNKFTDELRKHFGENFVQKFKQAIIDGEVKEVPDTTHSRTHL